MTTITSLYVAARQNEMLAQAAAERLARSATKPVVQRNRLADAVKSAWSLLSGPAERPNTLPRLSDYPFRS